MNLRTDVSNALETFEKPVLARDNDIRRPCPLRELFGFLRAPWLLQIYGFAGVERIDQAPDVYCDQHRRLPELD